MSVSLTKCNTCSATFDYAEEGFVDMEERTATCQQCSDKEDELYQLVDEVVEHHITCECQPCQRAHQLNRELYPELGGMQ